VWQYNPFVKDETGLLVTPQYNAQTALSGIPAMVIARVMAVAMNDVMFVNPFATNVVKTAQIHSWLYEDIARIESTERN